MAIWESFFGYQKIEEKLIEKICQQLSTNQLLNLHDKQFLESIAKTVIISEKELKDIISEQNIDTYNKDILYEKFKQCIEIYFINYIIQKIANDYSDIHQQMLLFFNQDTTNEKDIVTINTIAKQLDELKTLATTKQTNENQNISALITEIKKLVNTIQNNPVNTSSANGSTNKLYEYEYKFLCIEMYIKKFVRDKTHEIYIKSYHNNKTKSEIKITIEESNIDNSDNKINIISIEPKNYEDMFNDEKQDLNSFSLDLFLCLFNKDYGSEGWELFNEPKYCNIKKTNTKSYRCIIKRIKQ